MGGEGREGDFQMFEFLTASVLCSENMHHHFKFCADRSNRCRDMAVFFNGGRPPFWIYQNWLTHREPNVAPSRNWYLMVISNSLVQKWCLWNNLNNHGVFGD